MGEATELTALPWVGRRAPALGARAAALAGSRLVYGLYPPRIGANARDVQEQRAARTLPISSPGADAGRVTLQCMCRNIRTLHNFEPPATEEEIRYAALQYVRKVSGSTKPSQANAEAFERAVDEVAHITATCSTTS